MRNSRLVAIGLFLFSLALAFSASSSHAFSFNVISDPVLLSQKDALFGISVSDLEVGKDAIYGVDLANGETTEDQAYALDPDTGEITFGDGIRGARPPSGTGGTAAAYRYGSGSTGVVINPLPIPLDALPVLIPLDDPSTGNVEETEISFFLSGISSFQFEVVQDGVWITSITPIPEPSTLLLLGSGLVGLMAVRRKLSVKASTYRSRQ